MPVVVVRFPCVGIIIFLHFFIKSIDFTKYILKRILCENGGLQMENKNRVPAGDLSTKTVFLHVIATEVLF